jgi:hypothetical protein
MDHDPARGGLVIEPAVETAEAQRQAVAALVGRAGDEGAEARRQTARTVGEAAGHVVAGATPMGHELVSHDALGRKVEHPEPPLAGGQSEVDHRQPVAHRRSRRDRLRMRLEREAQHLWTEAPAAPPPRRRPERGRRQIKHRERQRPGGEWHAPSRVTGFARVALKQ